MANEEQQEHWREEVDSLGGLAISTLRDILECGPFSAAMSGKAAGLCLRAAIAVIDRIHKPGSKIEAVASAQLQKDQSAEPVQLTAEPIERQPPSDQCPGPSPEQDAPAPVSAQSGEPAESDQFCTTPLFRADRIAAAERARSDAFDAAQAKELAATGALGG